MVAIVAIRNEHVLNIDAYTLKGPEDEAMLFCLPYLHMLPEKV